MLCHKRLVVCGVCFIRFLHSLRNASHSSAAQMLTETIYITTNSSAISLQFHTITKLARPRSSDVYPGFQVLRWFSVQSLLDHWFNKQYFIDYLLHTLPSRLHWSSLASPWFYSTHICDSNSSLSSTPLLSLDQHSCRQSIHFPSLLCYNSKSSPKFPIYSPLSIAKFANQESLKPPRLSLDRDSGWTSNLISPFICSNHRSDHYRAINSSSPKILRLLTECTRNLSAIKEHTPRCTSWRLTQFRLLSMSLFVCATT